MRPIHNKGIILYILPAYHRCSLRIQERTDHYKAYSGIRTIPVLTHNHYPLTEHYRFGRGHSLRQWDPDKHQDSQGDICHPNIHKKDHAIRDHTCKYLHKMRHYQHIPHNLLDPDQYNHLQEGLDHKYHYTCLYTRLVLLSSMMRHYQRNNLKRKECNNPRLEGMRNSYRRYNHLNNSSSPLQRNSLGSRNFLSLELLRKRIRYMLQDLNRLRNSMGMALHISSRSVPTSMAYRHRSHSVVYRHYPHIRDNPTDQVQRMFCTRERIMYHLTRHYSSDRNQSKATHHRYTHLHRGMNLGHTIRIQLDCCIRGIVDQHTHHCRGYKKAHTIPFRMFLHLMRMAGNPLSHQDRHRLDTLDCIDQYTAYSRHHPSPDNKHTRSSAYGRHILSLNCYSHWKMVRCRAHLGIQDHTYHDTQSNHSCQHMRNYIRSPQSRY